MSSVVPFLTSPTACFRVACRGTANPIPRLPRTPIPALGLFEPPGGPPLSPGPMFSSEISKNVPPISIASDDESSLPTSWHDTPL